MSASRVLHLLESDGIYGAEQMVLTLSEQARRAAAFEPVVGCFVAEPNEKKELLAVAESLGLATLPLVLRKRALPLDLWRALRAVKRADVDLVHSHNYKPSLVAFLAQMVWRIPATATSHLQFVGESSSWSYRVLLALQSRLFRFFPAVTAVSPAIRDHLLRGGLAAEQVLLVENGVSLPGDEIPKPDKESARRELGIDDDSRVIVNLARLTEQKGHRFLLDAIADLVDGGRKIQLLIAGEGELRPVLEQTLGERGLRPHVRLLGYWQEPKKLLAAADLFVLSSLDEGLPMSLLEAMAFRVPVVATAVGGIPGVIADGHNGLLVPPEESGDLSRALARVLDDYELASELVAHAWTDVSTRFSAEAMCSRYVEIYQSMATL